MLCQTKKPLPLPMLMSKGRSVDLVSHWSIGYSDQRSNFEPAFFHALPEILDVLKTGTSSPSRLNKFRKHITPSANIVVCKIVNPDSLSISQYTHPDNGYGPRESQ